VRVCIPHGHHPGHQGDLSADVGGELETVSPQRQHRECAGSAQRSHLAPTSTGRSLRVARSSP
jgi:hypothetical protein